MQNRSRNFITYVLMAGVFIICLGCGTTKSLVGGDSPVIRKKVMIFPPTDDSGLASENAIKVSSDLVELLKDSDHLLVFSSPESPLLSEADKAPRFGVAHYNPLLVDMAKEQNMNVLLSVYLPPITTSKGRKGIWPFRYDADICSVSIIVNAMDTLNGCLYLTAMESEEVKFESEEIKDLSPKDVVARAFEMAIPEMLERQAKEIKKKLSQKSWTGRILGVDAGILRINGGKDQGMIKDLLITVYAQGETIACQTDRSLKLLGEKVGEIKVVSVEDQYSMAMPLTGGPFEAGQTIMFAPED